MLRVSAIKYRKESDLPKLKEQAKKLCKEYAKTNKHNKIKEVETAYQQIKQKITQECNSAGAKAFNRVMVNRPPAEKRKRPDASPAPKPSDSAARAPNPAEAHFLKVQGAASANAPQGPPQRLKSREEQIREKAAARRGNKEAREEENAKRPLRRGSPQAPARQRRARRRRARGRPSGARPQSRRRARGRPSEVRPRSRRRARGSPRGVRPRTSRRLRRAKARKREAARATPKKAASQRALAAARWK